jgi:hypothetical protein
MVIREYRALLIQAFGGDRGDHEEEGREGDGEGDELHGVGRCVGVDM